MPVRVVRGDQGGTVSVTDTGAARSLLVLRAPGRPSTVIAPEARPEDELRRADADEEEIWITLDVRPFRLIVDTSELPGGALVFDEARFLERAQREGERRGRLDPTHVRLTSATAPEWGFEGSAQAMARKEG